jgi:hypothetical protein
MLSLCSADQDSALVRFEMGAFEDRHLTKTNVQIIGGGPLPLAPSRKGRGRLCAVEAMLSAHPLGGAAYSAEGEDVQST